MMMEPSVSLSEDTALVEALTKLQVLEKENARLRFSMSSTSSSGERHSTESIQEELTRLRRQVEEVSLCLTLWWEDNLFFSLKANLISVLVSCLVKIYN